MIFNLKRPNLKPEKQISFYKCKLSLKIWKNWPDPALHKWAPVHNFLIRVWNSSKNYKIIKVYYLGIKPQFHLNLNILTYKSSFRSKILCVWTRSRINFRSYSYDITKNLLYCVQPIINTIFLYTIDIHKWSLWVW